MQHFTFMQNSNILNLASSAYSNSIYKNNYSPRGQISDKGVKYKLSHRLTKTYSWSKYRWLWYSHPQNVGPTSLGMEVGRCKSYSQKPSLAPVSCKPTAWSSKHLSSLPALSALSNTHTIRGYFHLQDASIWQKKRSKIKRTRGN